MDRAVRRIRLLIVAAGLAVFALQLAPVSAQQPRRSEDPDAAKSHAPRGSAREKESHEKNEPRAKEDSAPEQSGSAKEPRGKLKLPHGSEVRSKLEKGERPAKRFLQQGKAKKPLPHHENRLENARVRDPEEFTVEYELDADADVTVTIVGENGAPVRRVEFAAGQRGGRAGKNRVSLWDGQDFAGEELAPGDYTTFLTVSYPAASDAGAPSAADAKKGGAKQGAKPAKGKRENRLLRLKKR